MPFKRREVTLPHKYTKYILGAFIVIEIGFIVGALLCWRTSEYITAIILGFIGILFMVTAVIIERYELKKRK